MQTKDDGTHIILPVADALAVLSDHARLPVMMLRHSDGKVRRDGSTTATSQPDPPVAERGGLHGAPGLSAVVGTAHCREEKNSVQCKRGETTLAKKIRLIPPIRTAR